MRIVIDTNVFISALISEKSIPGRIIEEVFENQLDIVCSEEQLQEINAVLFYPKVYRFLHKKGWNKELLQDYVERIRAIVDLINIRSTQVIVPRDRKDDHILALLIAGEADYLVTGDNDLLSLNEEYPILTPKEFVDKWAEV